LRNWLRGSSFRSGTSERGKSWIEVPQGNLVFGKFFAEFTLALGTPRYDALPARKFDEAVAWLKQRAAELLPGDDSALPPRQERLL
jgi:hypothetical protein